MSFCSNWIFEGCGYEWNDMIKQEIMCIEIKCLISGRSTASHWAEVCGCCGPDQFHLYWSRIKKPAVSKCGTLNLNLWCLFRQSCSQSFCLLTPVPSARYGKHFRMKPTFDDGSFSKYCLYTHPSFMSSPAGQMCQTFQMLLWTHFRSQDPVGEGKYLDVRAWAGWLQDAGVRCLWREITLSKGLNIARLGAIIQHFGYVLFSFRCDKRRLRALMPLGCFLKMEYTNQMRLTLWKFSKYLLTAAAPGHQITL